MLDKPTIILMEDEKTIEIAGEVPLNEFMDFILDYFEDNKENMKNYKFTNNIDYVSIN